MFSDFFLYLSELPSDSGFAFFGKAHLIWLCALALTGFLLCLKYQKTPRAGKRKMEIGLGWSIFLLIFLQYVFLILKGVIRFYHLPLTICGMSVFLIFLNALWPGKWKRDLIYTFTFPAAAVALLFPDFHVYPPFSFMCIIRFLISGISFFYPVLLLSGREWKPDPRYLPRCFLTAAAVLVSVFFLNRRLGTNFLLLSRLPDSEPYRSLSQWLGSPAYVWAIACGWLMIWCILYFPFCLGWKNRK